MFKSGSKGDRGAMAPIFADKMKLIKRELEILIYWCLETGSKSWRLKYVFKFKVYQKFSPYNMLTMVKFALTSLHPIQLLDFRWLLWIWILCLYIWLKGHLTFALWPYRNWCFTKSSSLPRICASHSIVVSTIFTIFYWVYLHLMYYWLWGYCGYM